MTRIVSGGQIIDVPATYAGAGHGDETEPTPTLVPAVMHPTNALPGGKPRAIYCTAAGDLVCSFDEGLTQVTVPMDAKTWHPIRPTHIRLSSTAQVLLGY